MPALTNVTHEKFAMAYANCGISAQAAEAAGTSRSYGRAIAERPDVQARVGELVDIRFRKENVTAQRVIHELARIAFANLADLFDTAGELLPIHELPDDVAATLSQVEVEVKGRGAGENRETVIVKKVKQASKMEALTILAKHFKVIGDVDDGVNAVVNVLAERLNAARHRDMSRVEDAVEARVVTQGQKLTYAFDDGPSKPDDLSPARPQAASGHPNAHATSHGDDNEERLW